MAKRCIICGEEAEYKIKDTPDYYCKGCAEENFADLTLLVKVEEEVQRLKKFLDEKMNNGQDENNEQDDRAGEN